MFFISKYTLLLRLLTRTFLSSNQFDVVTSLVKIGGGVPNPFGKICFPSKLDHVSPKKLGVKIEKICETTTSKGEKNPS